MDSHDNVPEAMPLRPLPAPSRVYCSADSDSNASTHSETKRDCPPSKENSNRRSQTRSDRSPDPGVRLFVRHESHCRHNRCSCVEAEAPSLKAVDRPGLCGYSSKPAG